MTSTTGTTSRLLSRRAILSGAGAIAIAGTAAAAVEVVSDRRPDQQPSLAATSYYGDHQPGIATAQPSTLLLTAFDLTTSDRAAVVSLLKRWTAAADTLMRGALLAAATNADSPPPDSGETRGLPPSGLTLTFGFGAGAFDARFGLAGARPTSLAPIPQMRGDALEEVRGGGDLVVQACADDEMVAFHAMRQLTRIAAGLAATRWSQRGFGATTTAGHEQTPRNLFGQKDGTANPQAGTLAFAPVVVAQPGDDPEWMVGGSYLVFRRIRMDLDGWDTTSVSRQNQVLGRNTITGAPLSGGSEFSAPDFGATSHDGELLIPADAHVRLANPAFNSGAEMLRRGYSYDDGYGTDGSRDAGLAFLAYVRDVPTQFTPVLRALTEHDAMHAFLIHTASAVFAIPPGCHAGGFAGDTLLA